MPWLDSDYLRNDYKNEPLQANHALLYLPDIPPDHADSEKLVFKSFDIPVNSNPIIEQSFQNRTIKFPGRQEFEGFEATLRHTISKEAIYVMEKWRSYVSNPVTGQVARKGYKTTAYVVQYTPYGDIADTYLLYGVWPSSMEVASFGSSNNEVVEATITFSVDHYQKLNDTGIHELAIGSPIGD